MNTSSFGIEKATLIRVPATANLLIDSVDRDGVAPSPWDFTITKKNQLINGYFTRAGTTEVVLEWCDGNIWSENFAMQFDVSGSAVRINGVTQLAVGGFYTVADALNQFIGDVNDLSGSTGVSVKVNKGFGIPFIQVTGGHIAIDSGDGLAEALGLSPLDEEATSILIQCPDLRRYRYLDFTSSQLTSVQDVKDASTAPLVRDVLCRWYMADDVPENEDEYGFPILMGYKQFSRRRIFNPPKQIKWEQNFPVGNLAFQVFANDGALPTTFNYAGQEVASKSNWLMTLQLTEG